MEPYRPARYLGFVSLFHIDTLGAVYTFSRVFLFSRKKRGKRLVYRKPIVGRVNFDDFRTIQPTFFSLRLLCHTLNGFRTEKNKSDSEFDILIFERIGYNIFLYIL